jgi:hypothetical protein
MVCQTREIVETTLATRAAARSHFVMLPQKATQRVDIDFATIRQESRLYAVRTISTAQDGYRRRLRAHVCKHDLERPTN